MNEQKSVREPKKVNLMNAVVSLLGLAVIFAVAYGIDYWSVILRRQVSANFVWSSYYWFLSLSNLIIAGLLFVLAWFVCYRTDKRWLISLTFLIIGLFGTFVFAVEYSTLSSSRTFMVTPFFLAPNWRTNYVAAFSIVIGFARLLISKND